MMLKSNMTKSDFDSMSSSSSTSSYTIGLNGEKIYTSGSKQTSTQNNESKETVEEYEAPKLPDYEDPNQVYEDSNEESHTFKRLNGELDSEQSHVANEADDAADLGRYLRRDYSYDEDFDSDPLDELDPNQNTIDQISESDDSLDSFLTGLY